MKTGKEIILDYCDNIETGDIDHLQSCIDIREALRNNGDINYLYYHCPGNYGIDDFIGECEIITVDRNHQEQLKQCKKCWDRALNMIEN